MFRENQQIYQMFAAYFHRDYDLMIDIDRNKPIFPQLIQGYKDGSPKEDIDEAISEVENLINKNYNSDILEDIFLELGIEFDVSFYGYTHQQFLIEVLKILKK